MASDYSRYFEYDTLQGDTFDSIALDFYGDEYKANLLAEANPEHIRTLKFEAGVLLWVPIIEATAATTLPPWKQG